jgi:Protein of unknown function (DUF3108)
MPVRTVCAGLLGMTVSGFAMAEQQSPPAAEQQSAPAVAAQIAPFSAHYGAEWKGISVGTSDLQLRQDGEPDHYVYKWTITARGIFRLVYADDLTQQSWFMVTDNHVRPLKYRAEEGSSSVSFDFDWDGGHARGRSENNPVDIELKSGTQDLMSIQVEVMLDLKNNDLPKLFHIVDKDKSKDFVYAQEGTASLRTALGQLDTVIVSSRQTGNNRILWMWFAPSLGYVPVQAERTRDGKLEFAMRIKSLKR